MSDKCTGCAFRPGTEANKDEHTQLIVKLCLESREPFYCHMVEPGDLIECTGYVEAVKVLVEKDYYVEWRQELATRLMVVLENAEDGLYSEQDLQSGKPVIDTTLEFLREREAR